MLRLSPSSWTITLLLLLCTTTTTLLLLAPCSAGTAGGWSLYPHNPVLGPGLGVLFDVSVLTSPSTPAHRYQLYNSWRSDNASHAVDAIALSTSPNGSTWSGQRIVLPPLPSSSWESVVNRPSVIRRGASGAYEMWYTGQSTNESFIGVAHSGDGVEWKRQSSAPVLSPNGSSWEKVAVMCPHAVYNRTASPPYRLYYSGGEQEEPDAIGLAYSTDGLTFTRSPLNPILSPNRSQPWEAVKVTGAQVIPPQPGHAWWVAVYIGFADVDTASINLARSRDGVGGWERHPDNPVITHGVKGEWHCDAVYKPFATWNEEEGRWLLWFNGRCGDVEAIGLALHPRRDFGFNNASTPRTSSRTRTRATAQRR